MTIIRPLERLSTSVDWLIIRLVFVLFAGLVITTTMQVVFRVFFSALTWSEELSRYLLVWTTFFAATMAYKRGNHITITFAVELFKPKVRIVLTILSYLASMFFFIVIIYYSLEMIKLQTFQISPALSLPMQIVYSSIPISLFIMLIHALAGISRDLGIYAEGVRQR